MCRKVEVEGLMVYIFGELGINRLKKGKPLYKNPGARREKS